MFKDILADTDYVNLPLVALILFMVVFVAVIVVIWRRGKHHPKHEHLKHLPLEDDTASPDEEDTP
ncbi:MAG: CcoQ/FixQ family Cbb3-type cytochrome c oxidase assembly chaperone [Myxococcota bacterium]